MRKRGIDTIDTSYIDDVHYLMQIPALFHRNIKFDHLAIPPPRGHSPQISYNNQTNFNIQIHNNGKGLKEESMPLLQEYDENGVHSGTLPVDHEDECCRCVIC